MKKLFPLFALSFLMACPPAEQAADAGVDAGPDAGAADVDAAAPAPADAAVADDASEPVFVDAGEVAADAA